MNAFLSLGRWLFAIPFAIFGLFHFLNAENMAMAVPDFLPARVVWVYLTGAGLIAAAVSMLSEKYDKLSSVLLAVMLLVFSLILHMKGAMYGATELAKSTSMGMLLKDMALAGAAMMYAKYQAVDRSVIG